MLFFTSINGYQYFLPVSYPCENFCMLCEPSGRVFADVRTVRREVFLPLPTTLPSHCFGDDASGSNTRILALNFQQKRLLLTPLRTDLVCILWIPFEMGINVKGGVRIPAGVSIEIRTNDKIVIVPATVPLDRDSHNVHVETFKSEAAHCTFVVYVPDRHSVEDSLPLKGSKYAHTKKSMYSVSRGKHRRISKMRVHCPVERQPSKLPEMHEGFSNKIENQEEENTFCKEEQDEVSVQKPFCRYGKHCYQKNDHHLNTFRHDFENSVDVV